MANILWKLCALISVIEIADNIVYCVDLPKQAFIQVDNELTYLIDGVPIHMDDIIKTGDELRYGDAEDRGVPSKNYIIFDPPQLDFKQHPTGMPLMRKVMVQNTSPDTNIQLHSLSGNTLHFHCTFFQDKVVSPGGNTSFDVVFLGREEGLIENTIFIHTSIGTYKYGVRAIGTGNPYRLRPLVGVRMPLNSSYSPHIQLHNPHPHPLQVTEMYSTGGDLHLELLSGSQEGLKDQWKISPYHTKSLIKANFVARRENNHTAYVRIVTTDPDGGYLVVPVEVEVTSSPGLFFPQDGLHFGVLTPNDPPVTLPLYLLNSAHKHIHIQNVITTPVNDAIAIDFKPMKIPPGTVKATKVATVTVDPSKLQSVKKVSGKLLIKSKVSAYKLSVPYTVDLYQGALVYNSSVTSFYTGLASSKNETKPEVKSSRVGMSSTSKNSSNPSQSTLEVDLEDSEVRTLTLTNTFPCPVVIYTISLPKNAMQHFEIEWLGNVVIQEGQSAKVATLKLLSVRSDLRLNTTLTVSTNITTITIPLLSYNGKLTKYIPSTGKDQWLDFGTLGKGEQRDLYFYILNENPVELRLQGWGSTLSFGSVVLMGVERGNLTTLKTQTTNMSYSSKSLYLKPQHYAYFRVGVLTPDAEGIFVAEAFVRTQHELIKIPFRLRTADGTISVVPSTIVLDKAFPGKISHKDLYIRSSFGHPMTVKEVRPQSPDHRYIYEAKRDDNMSLPTLLPGHENHIGRLTFDPRADCADDCYAGFSLSSKGGHQWINTLSLTSHVADTDASLYTSLQSKYHNLSTHAFNTSIVLDTSEVQGFLFNAQVHLTWPRVISTRLVTFPLTQVSNTTIKKIYVENPSDQPVVAQLLFLHNYPATQPLLSIIQQQLPNGFGIPREDGNGAGPSDTFMFIDQDHLALNGGSQSQSGSSVSPQLPLPDPQLTSGHAQHRKALETLFKTRVSKDSIMLLLEPNVKIPIRIAFSPTDVYAHSAVLLVRNNLTVVDAAILHGRGGRGYLKFGSRKPGSSMPLMFTIGPKHLKDCDNNKNTKYSQPNFTVKRTFTARNTGELPVEIWGFTIGDLPCQGYGFKVLDCQGFRLLPNDSRKVDVAFTPDFTLSKIFQKLIIHTSLGPITDGETGEGLSTTGQLEYGLQATVPAHLLIQCGSAVPRPHWEPIVYYSILTILVCMLVVTIMLAVLEAEHTLKTTVISMPPSAPADDSIPAYDKSKVFNLRNIGNEIKVRDGYISGLHEQDEKNTQTTRKGSVSALNSSRPKTSQHQSYSGQKTSKSQKYTDQEWNYTNSNSRDGESYESIRNILSNNKSNINKNNHKSNKSHNVKNTLIEFFSRAIGKGEDVQDMDRSLSNSQDKSYSKNDNNTYRREQDMQVIEQYNNNSNTNKSKRKNKQLSEEETSSTTTESSNTDELSVNDTENNMHKSNESMSMSNSTGKNNKKRNNKNKSTRNTRNENSRRTQSTGSAREEDSAFEITTKSKGSKKTKEASESGSGQNSDYLNGSLELPYVVKTQKNKDNDSNKENKRIKNKYIKNTESCESMGSSRSSPASNWEDCHRNSNENTSSASHNVSASNQQSRPMSEHQPLAPRVSYSSILLGDKHKAKVAPIGKILPEVKRVDKILGPIGPIGKNNSCPTNNPTYPSQLTMPNGGLVSPMQNSNSLFQAQDGPLHNSYFMAMGNNQGVISNAQSMNVHSWDPKTLRNPMMRPPPGIGQSQADHPSYCHPTLSTEEEWSRYNPSLWQDNTGYSPTSLNNTVVNTGTIQPPPIQSPFPWSAPWASNQNPVVTNPNPTMDTNHMSPWDTSLASLQSTRVSEGLGFNPFGSIWMPNAVSEDHGTDGWSLTTKKKDV